MKKLDEIGEDSEMMKKSFKLAVQELEKVLDRKAPHTDLTELAAHTIGDYTKLKASESHDRALMLMMMRMQSKHGEKLIEADQDKPKTIELARVSKQG